MTVTPLTMTALATPLNEKGQVDFEGFRKLVQHQMDAGLTHLLLLGSTGEAMLLEQDEKQKLIDYAMSIKGISWWLGCLEASLAKALTFLESTAHLPIQGYLLLTPYYIKPTQADIEHFFHSLLEASTHPCILYNNPSRCSVNVSEETLSRFFSHPRFLGLKECDLNPLRVLRLRQKMSPKHYLLAGDDAHLPSALCSGASGVISVLSNAFPQLARELVENYGQDFRWAKLSTHWLKGCQLIDSLGNPRGIKSLLSLILKTGLQLKAPLQPINELDLKKLKEQLLLTSLLQSLSTKSLV